MPINAGLAGLLLPYMKKDMVHKQVQKVQAQDAYRKIRAEAAIQHAAPKPTRTVGAPVAARRTSGGGARQGGIFNAQSHYNKPSASSIGPTAPVDSFNAAKVVWPTTGRKVSTYTDHDGVDINGVGQDLGNPIYAYRSGKITFAGEGRGYGNAIFEQPKVGPPVVYGHGSEVYVNAGDRVKAGQLIGRVGSTGHSTGPHLHFGVPGGNFEEAMKLLQNARYLPNGASGQ